MIYELTLVAIIPALFLLVLIYNADKKEKEPLSLIFLLVVGGILSALLAVILEKMGIALLDRCSIQSIEQYSFILYFFIIAPAEELSKYLILRKGSWKHSAFNCFFDGIVYGVSVSLGFALYENLIYTFNYGLLTALSRSVTAIPAHASYGIFMGLWYGISKKAKNQNQRGLYRFSTILSCLIPILIHGCYDFCLVQTGGFSMIFLLFIILLFMISYQTVKKASSRDRVI